MQGDDYDFEFLDDETQERFVVDLDREICNCRAYKISVISCKPVISHVPMRYELSVDYMYLCVTVEAYIGTYFESIKLLLDKKKWPIIEDSEIKPLEMLIQVGRPKKMARKKYPNELLGKRKKEATDRYTNYDILGCNKRSCKNL